MWCCELCVVHPAILLAFAPGTKFFVTASKHMTRQQLAFVLDKVYKLYADYVLKNPFYELEQPIQCEKFDIMLDRSLKVIAPSRSDS